MWARMRCMIISRDQIAATLQDDDVGKFAAWLHILLVHGLYRGEVLGDDGLEGPAPFLHIPQSTAEDADVGIRLHKDLNVKHIPESGVLENQDALYDDNLGRENFPGLLRAVVLHIRVDRAADGAALFQLLQMLGNGSLRYRQFLMYRPKITGLPLCQKMQDSDPSRMS